MADEGGPPDGYHGGNEDYPMRYDNNQDGYDWDSKGFTLRALDLANLIGVFGANAAGETDGAVGNDGGSNDPEYPEPPAYGEWSYDQPGILQNQEDQGNNGAYDAAEDSQQYGYGDQSSEQNAFNNNAFNNNGFNNNAFNNNDYNNNDSNNYAFNNYAFNNNDYNNNDANNNGFNNNDYNNNDSNNNGFNNNAFSGLASSGMVDSDQADAYNPGPANTNLGSTSEHEAFKFPAPPTPAVVDNPMANPNNFSVTTAVDKDDNPTKRLRPDGTPAVASTNEDVLVVQGVTLRGPQLREYQKVMADLDEERKKLEMVQRAITVAEAWKAERLAAEKAEEEKFVAATGISVREMHAICTIVKQVLFD
ncbi:hypothetical protein LTR78_003230 [Recurvomyces mirabilis]|uniref:Uncharacterized protein n=1 Tax=Recurvomyces mirabilis TaxID=574656 RepID=A0AAE0WS37_9PEZI|nr:hypothetical protein LTR78_003230 [Recurvomyces mirabilis]